MIRRVTCQRGGAVEGGGVGVVGADRGDPGRDDEHREADDLPGGDTDHRGQRGEVSRSQLCVPRPSPLVTLLARPVGSSSQRHSALVEEGRQVGDAGGLLHVVGDDDDACSRA